MLARKLKIPKKRGYELDQIYDTQQVGQNDAEVNFFPNQASRNIQIANYVSNALPGDQARMVFGLSFEIVKEAIVEDTANNIDPVAIVNALKYAGVTITADQDNKEFLRAPVEKYLNFAGTTLEIASGAADYTDAAIPVGLLENKTAVLKSSSNYRLAEPFFIAPNQVFNVDLKFNDGSVLPADADWNASGQSLLYLRARMQVLLIPGKEWSKVRKGNVSLIE